MKAMGQPAMCSAKPPLTQRFFVAVRNLWGAALEMFHRPARIREFEYVDPITDKTVILSTGARYSVLHVGNKQFYFERTTGKFDGTCTSLEERVSNGLELLD